MKLFLVAQYLLATMMFSCNASSVPAPVPMARPYRVVNLKWNPSPTEGVTYRMYRNTNGGTFTLLASLLSTTSYSDSTIQRKKTYCYEVTAFNGLESQATTPWCVTTI